MNIVEIATGSDDFNILVQALTAADLVTTIQTSNDITVFAPTDAAFTALAVDLGFAGDQTDETAVFNHIAGALAGLAEDGDPIPLLTNILLYHVSGSVLDAAAVTAASSIPTLLSGAEIAPAVPRLGDLEPDLLDPSLVQTDLPADNGIVHVIDRVLLPIDIPGNTNLVDIAAGSDDFNILVQALGTAGLVDTIRNADDITIFAPTDAAFAALAADLGFTGDPSDETAVFDFIAGALTALDPNGDPIPLLTQILTYHVAGSVLDSAAVTAASTIPTLAGADITPDVPVLEDLEPDLINASLVLDAIDIAGSNGLIHTIDRVLLPLDVPGNDVPSITGLVASSGDGPDADNTDFDLLLAAVQTAGLAETLDTAGLDATVFAPNDAAFIALAQDLGFTGTDEAGALTAIVETLTALGSGNPLPLLTAILTYHVSPGAAQLSQIAGLTELATLQGGTIGIDGTTLVDNEPDLTDPTLVATDIQTSNGIVHVIDRVLLPVDIPASNGLNDVRIELGGDAPARLRGADDNDLLIDGSGRTDMRGLAGADTFVMSDDGVRDLIRDFELGSDRIDVSAFAASIDDLTISNAARGNGTTSWIKVEDWTGETEFLVRFGDGTELDAANLTADSFVFASEPLPTPPANEIADTEGRSNLRGTDQTDTFILLDDGARDAVRGFEVGTDKIDVSAFASSFEELTLSNRENAAGVTRWVNVTDSAGDTEVLVRFTGDTPLDAASLSADDFIFV